MLKYILSVAILFVPGIISSFIDCKITGKSKGFLSKYIVYSLINCLVMFSAMTVCCVSEHTVITAFNVPKFAMFFGAIAVIAASISPVIIRKRLPKMFANAFEYIVSHGIVFSLLSLFTGILFFAFRFISNTTDELFENSAMLFCVFLTILVPVLILAVWRILRGGFKNNIKTIVKRFKEKDTAQFCKQAGVAILIDIAFIFSVIMFIPFETLLGNASEFTFGFSGLWQAIARMSFAVFVLLLFVQLVLPKRISRFFVGLVFGITLATYVQSMFFNGSMSQMDGATETYAIGTAVVNLVVWIVLALVPAVLAFAGLRFWKTVCVIGCVLIVGMQSTALMSLGINYERPITESRLTTDGLYEVSNNSNTIVFVLDCFDIDNLKGVLEAEPDIFDDMHGFTGYTNVTGSYSFTHLAVPYLITGERIPEYNPTDEQFIGAAINSKYYNTIADSVSSYGVYVDEFCIKGEDSRSKLCNTTFNLKESVHNDVLIKMSQKASLYRALPFVLKNRFSYTSQDFNLALKSSSESEYYLVASQTDVAIKTNLATNGLSINPDYTDGCFRFIHTNGPHLPCYIDQNGNLLLEQTDVVSASIGSIKVVKEYIKALNDIGLYKDATIIITSDHGSTYTTLDNPNPDISINPIMFYKPSGAGYGDGFRFSSAPVSHDDIFPTIMDSLGFDYESKTGMKLDDVTEDMERTRYVYLHRREPGMPENLANYMHIEYIVKGDANDDESWHETDNIVHCNGWEEFFKN